MVHGLEAELTDELFLVTQPAHLQKLANQKLTAEQRDVLRASLLRERLKNVNRPKSLTPSFPPDAETGADDSASDS
jgi:protein arginine kinase